ncbi:hypothetical protein [Nocardia amikacinitolerans]|uniref:hypothetical protein n=1 Tax=Nocardia amikacinitolerans TaxID=756689 RepID=UPI0012ECC130|nr:hypothetical protein [Nocardia amikacinitolerans]
MTLNEISRPASIVGPVPYELWVRIPEDTKSDDPGFVVNGLTLPREGDDLTLSDHPTSGDGAAGQGLQR